MSMKGALFAQGRIEQLGLVSDAQLEQHLVRHRANRSLRQLAVTIAAQSVIGRVISVAAPADDHRLPIVDAHADET